MESLKNDGKGARPLGQGPLGLGPSFDGAKVDSTIGGSGTLTEKGDGERRALGFVDSVIIAILIFTADGATPKRVGQPEVVTTTTKKGDEGREQRTEVESGKTEREPSNGEDSLSIAVRTLVGLSGQTGSVRQLGGLSIGITASATLGREAI